MIRRTLFFTLCLFVIYNVALIVINPGFYIPQNQFQENMIKGQEYLYSNRAKKYVIVGSSLSTKIDMNVLPDHFFNLSFRGQSVYDGLEVIKQSGIKPEKVFIETNMYFKDIDKNFSKDLFTPGISTIRASIPAMQEKNRPVNSFTLLAFNLFEHINKSMADKIKGKLGIKFKSNTTDQPIKFWDIAKVNNIEKTGVFKEMIKSRAGEYQTPIMKDTIDRRIALLDTYIDYLTKQNVQVVFFEMPIEEELCASPRATFLRQELQKKFPSDRYQYIQSPDCKYFTTKDGIHLEDESATLYTRFLSEEVGHLAIME